MRLSSLPSLLILTATLTLLGGCSTPQISSREVKKSDPAAVSLIAASQKAYGAQAFRKVKSVTVAYEGQWAAIGPRLQPVLADTQFRRRSVETLNLKSKTITQEHTEPAGKKSVVRSPDNITVRYNGTPSTDEEITRAAALVADVYTLFLLGPFYFEREGVVLSLEGTKTVDRQLCDQVLAIIRPGFGLSKEDRVLLYIDRDGKQLRRVRITLNGVESTVGAEVDVTFRDFRKIDDILWPTDFDERIRVPIDLHAHHWRMVDLKTKYR